MHARTSHHIHPSTPSQYAPPHQFSSPLRDLVLESLRAHAEYQKIINDNSAVAVVPQYLLHTPQSR